MPDLPFPSLGSLCAMPDTDRAVSAEYHRGYAILSWAVLAFIVLVILGGVVVRASGSGDGCGASWPRCQGSIFPQSPGTETIIEFTHRMMTGAAGIGTLFLVFFAYRLYPKRHRIRIAATGALAFLIVESLLGASLVLFGWVDQDISLGRLIVVPLHLMNTYVLIAWYAVTAWWASGNPASVWEGRTALKRRLVIIGGILLVIGVFGAWNALADTVFPKDAVGDGLVASANAHFLERVRVIHPIVAVAGGFVVAAMAFPMADAAAGATRRLGMLLTGSIFLQFFVGVANLLMLTPIETQVLHLAVADAMWILFILFGASALADPVEAERPMERAV